MVSEKSVAIVGLGYVGLPLALLADRKGYFVVGLDTDIAKIALLQERKAPFRDASIEEALRSSAITFSSDPSDSARVNTIVMCVPTPVYENHMPNLEIVEAVSRSIGKHLQKGQLVIVESTVNPDVTECVVLPILEEASGLRGGKDFYLAHAPERINPGDPKWNVENINRVVGGLEAVSLERAVTFYESILTASVKRMASLKEAEAVKVVENSFRDINIAFVNELACSFSRLHIDVVNVIAGASTKPFGFMAHHPGCGVGGHCIPVDPYYLIEHAKKNGFHHDLLAQARRINNDMPHYTVNRLIEGLNEVRCSLKGSVVAVLGLSYKAGIDDMRESPSHKIISLLEERSAEVRTYDPYVLHASTVETLSLALTGAQAVVIVTAHDEFKALTPEMLSEYGVAVVIDGRNCLSKNSFLEAGFIYKGVGR